MSAGRSQLRLRRREALDGTSFFRVENRWYETKDGSEILRSVVVHPGAVGIVPYDGTRVWLIRQERVAVGDTVLEIPAGKLDVDGEAPDAAARRECEEEVGLRPDSLTLVHRFYNSPGFTDEFTHIYLGEDLERVQRAPVGAEEEAAEIIAFDLTEVRRMLATDRINDGKTVIGLHALVAREDGRG